MADRNLDLGELRAQLVALFNTEELQTLCFDLGIDYENLAGSNATRDQLARNLIAYLSRRGQLDDLIAIGRRVRPRAAWSEIDYDLGRTSGSSSEPSSEPPSEPPSGLQISSDRSPYLRVFLCHGSPDKAAVRGIYQKLKSDGFKPWLDEEDILPGNVWKLEISKALRQCEVVLVCCSRTSVNKAGYVQWEIRAALDRALEQPEGAIFVIPVKLEECELPDSLNTYQYVRYFDANGYQLLLSALRARAASLGIRPSNDFGYRQD